MLLLLDEIVQNRAEEYRARHNVQVSIHLLGLRGQRLWLLCRIELMLRGRGGNYARYIVLFERVCRKTIDRWGCICISFTSIDRGNGKYRPKKMGMWIITAIMNPKNVMRC
jgi:hypothetical protein